MMQQQNFRFLREQQVSALTGLSRSTRWRLEKFGGFPKRRQLSSRTVGWLASEIDEWMQTRAVVKTEINANEIEKHKNTIRKIT